MRRRSERRSKKAIGMLTVGGLALTAASPAAARSENFGDPIGNYNFRVEIEGMNAGYFTSLYQENELELVANQDPSDQRKRAGAGRTSYGDVTLKRGYVADDNLHYLFEEPLAETPIKTIAVQLLDGEGRAVRGWHYFECLPRKWELGTSSGGAGTELEERITFACDLFEEDGKL